MLAPRVPARPAAQELFSAELFEEEHVEMLQSREAAALVRRKQEHDRRGPTHAANTHRRPAAPPAAPPSVLTSGEPSPRRGARRKQYAQLKRLDPSIPVRRPRGTSRGRPRRQQPAPSSRTAAPPPPPQVAWEGYRFLCALISTRNFVVRDAPADVRTHARPRSPPLCALPPGPCDGGGSPAGGPRCDIVHLTRRGMCGAGQVARAVVARSGD